MGRLFWKFFFSFWLTLLVATISVGSAVWLKRAALDNVAEQEIKFIDYRATPFVDVAANIAKFNGAEALITFLQQLDSSPMPSVYAIDERDQDMLGRKVDSDALAQARSWHNAGKRRVIQQVDTERGNILLFATLADVHPEPKGRRQPPLSRERPLLLLILSGLIASVSFSALLAWYFTRPIRILKHAFQKVANGHLDTRVGPQMSNRHDEIGELGQHFDVMTSQVDSLLNSQRQLLHDVSHEMRSPLARMQAAIGIAEQQPDKISTTLKRLDRETSRMSDLVGELLLLSRLEAGINYTQSATIDLTSLLDDIVEDASFEASDKQLQIDYQRADNLTLSGHQELLYRAIENIIRNAIKFSDIGGAIRIHGTEKAGVIRIEVEDEGPGVSDADLDNLFSPFFRGQPATAQEGTGLGLTIAQRAIHAHNGIIQAENKPTGGLKLSIVLSDQAANE